MTAVAARPSLGPAGQDVRTSTAESFDHWRHLVAESFVPLAASSANADNFHGRMRARRLDRVALVEVSSTSHEVHRTPALIAQSNQRYFKLNLQLQGTGLLIQDNREAVLHPGDLSIYDTSRPYTLAFEGDARLMVVMFPWDALSLPPECIAQLSAVRMASDGGLAAIVGPFIAHLAENLEALSGPSGSRLATNALDLVSTMLHSELDMSPDRMKPQALLAASVREYIDAHLADPHAVAGLHRGGPFHLHPAPAQRLP